jgi:hypothetical protein
VSLACPLYAGTMVSTLLGSVELDICGSCAGVLVAADVVALAPTAGVTANGDGTLRGTALSTRDIGEIVAVELGAGALENVFEAVVDALLGL